MHTRRRKEILQSITTQRKKRGIVRRNISGTFAELRGLPKICNPHFD